MATPILLLAEGVAVSSETWALDNIRLAESMARSHALAPARCKGPPCARTDWALASWRGTKVLTNKTLALFCAQLLPLLPCVASLRSRRPSLRGQLAA